MSTAIRSAGDARHQPDHRVLPLHGYAKLARGAWVAQTGASSATAGFVVALAKHAGLRRLTSCDTRALGAPLLEAGGDVVLVEGADLDERAAEAIGGAPLELIIDAVSGEPVAKLASLLRIGGPVVSYTARNRQPLSSQSSISFSGG